LLQNFKEINSMNRLRLGLLFPLVLVLTIMVPSRAGAQCAGTIANFASALELNLEGRTERPADFAITSPGAPPAAQTCFVAGNSVRVTYNAILTNPTAVSNATPNNFKITDAAGTLVVNVSTTTGVGASGPQTVIQIDVITGTTDPLASFTLTNLRFDVTTIGATTGGVPNMDAFLSSTVPATVPAATGVGIVRNTINSGLTNLVLGQGTQSAGGPLTNQATLTFSDALNGWTNINPFRVAISTPVVATDIPTGATTLTFDVENIPSGVTVTFPATMTAVPGATPVVFTATSGTLSGTGGSLVVTYATTKANVPAFTLGVTTGATASDFVPAAPGPPPVPAVPITIGVQIGTASGNGTANLRVVFGPSEASEFTGDNASATAIPRYIASILPGAANRSIVAAAGPNPAPGSPLPFFKINPTQSVLLYQYATDQASYKTGIAVSNTGKDDPTIFNASNPFGLTKGQTGPITFYLFQTGTTTPVIYTVKSGNGRGLDANGNLPPGNTFAISLDELLTDAGQSALVGNFSGYIIALCEFNFGHGFDIVFNQNGVGTAVNSLYLGTGFRVDAIGEGLLQ
jgi:hypothetical protein